MVEGSDGGRSEGKMREGRGNGGDVGGGDRAFVFLRFCEMYFWHSETYFWFWGRLKGDKGDEEGDKGFVRHLWTKRKRVRWTEVDHAVGAGSVKERKFPLMLKINVVELATVEIFPETFKTGLNISSFQSFLNKCQPPSFNSPNNSRFPIFNHIIVVLFYVIVCFSLIRTVSPLPSP